MKIQVLDNAETVAHEAARFIAAQARAAVALRSRFVMAVSGGKTPWQMLRLLANEEVPWKQVHVVQVDERIAPAGHADRNLIHLQDSLLGHARPARVYAMPVEERDLPSATARYCQTLEQIAGRPPILDLAHLGLGVDGHTASLMPDDPVLNIIDQDVALTEIHPQWRRMTLTYPILNRARQILWLVSGAEKTSMLARLLNADPSIPAGRIRQEQALLLADRAAAGEIPHS